MKLSSLKCSGEKEYKQSTWAKIMSSLVSFSLQWAVNRYYQNIELKFRFMNQSFLLLLWIEYNWLKKTDLFVSQVSKTRQVELE